MISSSNMVVTKTIYSPLEGKHTKRPSSNIEMNPKTLIAKEAIFQSTFSYVREAVLKLVRIKLADGEDVDKLKEMNKVKKKMLEDIRKQKDQLHQRFLEEEKRRREAEEAQKRIEEERRKEKQKREQAEEEQCKAKEKRRVAEEQKCKKQKEKEEARRKLEEYLKNPTYERRRRRRKKGCTLS